MDNQSVKRSTFLRKEALAAIVEHSNDAILSKTLDGIILSWNKGAERIYGYTAEEIVGKHVSTLAPPDRAPEFEDILSRLRQGERIEHFETIRCRKDGTIMNVSVTISPILDKRGRVVAASAIARDITDQKRLNAVSSLLASVVDSSDDAIFSKDLNGVVLSWNKGAERLYGYSPQEMVGQNVSKLVPEGRPNEIPAIMRRLSQGHRIEHYETVRQRKDRTIIHVALTISPVRDSSGTIFAASTVARDITARKRHEAERAQLISELNRSLNQKKLLLQEVYHRVKNNLQVISSILELQRRTIQNDPSAIASAFSDAVERIRAMALVHERLYETDDLEKLDFISHLQSLLSQVLRAYNMEKSIRVEITGDECELGLNLAVPLSMVFNELITNSVKHAFPGRNQGKIMIDCRVTNRRLNFKISDDGVGLPQDFDLLTSKSLGLRIVRLLTQQLKGTIMRGGEAGTTFEITIPLSPDPAILQ